MAKQAITNRLHRTEKENDVSISLYDMAQRTHAHEKHINTRSDSTGNTPDCREALGKRN